MAGVDLNHTNGDTGLTLQETVTDADGNAVALESGEFVFRHMATETVLGPFAATISGAGSNVASYRFGADDFQDGDGDDLNGGFWYQLQALATGGYVVTVPNNRNDWKMAYVSPRIE